MKHSRILKKYNIINRQYLNRQTKWTALKYHNYNKFIVIEKRNYTVTNIYGRDYRLAS